VSVASPTAAAPTAPPAALERPSKSLSVGYLAMLPLLGAYELALAADPGSARNAAELLLDQVVRPAGEHVAHARWALLALAGLAALALAKRRGVAVGAGVARVVLEGALAACVLGPLMVVVVRSLEPYVPALDVSWDPGARAPALASAALVFGAGAWEELLFRVGAYSLLYWLGLRLATALGAREAPARGAAELLGLGGSALLFALAHFDPVPSWIGLAPRPASPALFAWLCLGGVLLGLIFRWRGPGVAAWAHGLFNVALWVGVDPDVVW
jgi:hypothetical protein